MFANKLKMKHAFYSVTLITIQSGQIFGLLQQSIQTDAGKDQELKSR